MSQPAIFGAAPAAGGGELVGPGEGEGDGLGAGDPVGPGEGEAVGPGEGDPVGPGEGAAVGPGEGDVVGVLPTGGAAPLSDPPPPQAAMSDKNTMLADKGFKTRTTCAAGKFDCCLFVDILRHLNAVWLRDAAARVGSRLGARTKQRLCGLVGLAQRLGLCGLSAVFMRVLRGKGLERLVCGYCAVLFKTWCPIQFLTHSKAIRSFPGTNSWTETRMFCDLAR
jgi:hypothetical protein